MTVRSIAAPRSESAISLPVVRGPRIVPLLFFVLLVVAVFFAMIYLRIALDRSAFELDALQDDITLEQSAQLDLRLSIAELQNPLRITFEADRIGLIYPEERVALDLAAPDSPSTALRADASISALSENSP